VIAIRRSEVEEALQRGDWSQRTRAKLMAKWDIGRQTLWEDRTAVLSDWDREVNSEPRGHHRAALVQRARYAAQLAHNRMTVVRGPMDPITGDREDELVAQPDITNFLRAVQVEAKLLGANAPERVEVEHSGSVDLVVRTPEEKAMSVLRALPLACKVLGIDAPVIDIPVIETVTEAK
jgi:hypothetical protein